MVIRVPRAQTIPRNASFTSMVGIGRRTVPIHHSSKPRSVAGRALFPNAFQVVVSKCVLCYHMLIGTRCIVNPPILAGVRSEL